MFEKIKLLLLLFLIPCTSIFADTLTAGISQWPPWQMQQGKEFAGIMTEIFVLAVQNAGYEYKLVAVPNIRRNELTWGKTIDAEPGVIPEWRQKYTDVSVYTIPVFETVNIVLAKSGTFDKTDRINTFYGKTLGTNIGYYYTDGFEAAFDNGLIRREDTSTEGQSILQKLVLGRVDAVILDKYEAEYWIKELGLDREDFEIVYEFKVKSKLRIRFHKSRLDILDDINASLQDMLKKGEIDGIVQKYLR